MRSRRHSSLTQVSRWCWLSIMAKSVSELEPRRPHLEAYHLPFKQRTTPPCCQRTMIRAIHNCKSSWINISSSYPVSTTWPAWPIWTTTWRTAPNNLSNVTKMTIVIKKFFAITNWTNSRQLQRQTSRDQRPAHSISILIEAPTRPATCRRGSAKNWLSARSAPRFTLAQTWLSKYENPKRISITKVEIWCRTWWTHKTSYSANHQHSWKKVTIRTSKSFRKRMGLAL